MPSAGIIGLPTVGAPTVGAGLGFDSSTPIQSNKGIVARQDLMDRLPGRQDLRQDLTVAGTIMPPMMPLRQEAAVSGGPASLKRSRWG